MSNINMFETYCKNCVYGNRLLQPPICNECIRKTTPMDDKPKEFEKK